MRQLGSPPLFVWPQSGMYVKPGMPLPSLGSIFVTYWLGDLEQVTSPLWALIPLLQNGIQHLPPDCCKHSRLPTNRLPLLAPDFVQVSCSHELQGSWSQHQRWPNCPCPLPMSCPGVHYDPVLATEAWDFWEHFVAPKRVSEIMFSCLCLHITGSGTGIANCLGRSQHQYERTEKWTDPGLDDDVKLLNQPTLKLTPPLDMKYVGL